MTTTTTWISVARLMAAGCSTPTSRSRRVKAPGINIFSPIDGGGAGAGSRGADPLQIRGLLTRARAGTRTRTSSSCRTRSSTAACLAATPTCSSRIRCSGPYARGRQAARRAASQVRQGLQHRQPGRPDGDGAARKHARLHAASAHEDQHGYPDAIKDKRVLQGSALSRHRLSLGHGARPLRGAAVRVPLPDALGRDEQLGGRPADAAEVHPGDHRSATSRRLATISTRAAR